MGTPAFGATTGANSGTQAWDINLASAYGNNAGTYLYSPYFDLSNTYNAVLSFYQNFNTDQGVDGVILEYITNSAAPVWDTLGNFNDPNAQNWYNTNKY